MNRKCKLECVHGYEKDKKLLEELKRRVEITYRTRVNATNRLRNKNNEYKKLNIYYSALITGTSIITLGVDGEINGISIGNIVLMCSIILTYFMFYVSEQNLQERAYRMEATFKELDKLRNKISILLSEKEANITESVCKKLYREYEAVLASIENHEEIDYARYKLYKLKKDKIKKEELSYKEVESEIKKYESCRIIKLILKYALPIALIVIILIKIK